MLGRELPVPRPAHTDLHESQLHYYESVLDSTVAMLHSLQKSLARTGCADAAHDVGRALAALEDAWAAVTKDQVRALVNLE
jgi:hypothetical protein